MLININMDQLSGSSGFLRTELFFAMAGAKLPFHPLGGFAIPLMLWDNEPSQRTEAVFEAAG